VGGDYCAFSWKVPHFSQTFIMRGRLMITWAQISSPPHWHVPMDFRAAPWRATFCTLLSAISSRSFPLPEAAFQHETLQDHERAKYNVNGMVVQ
jgi:hypothetical protein